jgi:CheY-like chemotaxis protein
MNNPRIMLIDDSSTNNLLYESILQDEGYEVVVCDNPSEALNKTKEVMPGLILLDLMMPGLDGFNLMEKKNSDKSIASIPVIMLTAKADHESELKARSLGVKDFFAKPIGIKEITEAVKEYLKV